MSDCQILAAFLQQLAPTGSQLLTGQWLSPPLSPNNCCFADTVMIQCSPLGRIQLLNLYQAGLVGVLTGPARSLAGLTELQTLGLAMNSLSGPLPQDFKALAKLSVLNMAGNSLSSTIPGTWNSLNKLANLDLSNNSLSGPLPDFFSTFFTLSILDLGLNSFTGSIPNSWGGLSNLHLLNLTGNPLINGAFPSPSLMPLTSCSLPSGVCSSSKTNAIPAVCTGNSPLVCSTPTSSTNPASTSSTGTPGNNNNNVTDSNLSSSTPSSSLSAFALVAITLGILLVLGACVGLSYKLCYGGKKKREKKEYEGLLRKTTPPSPSISPSKEPVIVQVSSHENRSLPSIPALLPQPSLPEIDELGWTVSSVAPPPVSLDRFASSASKGSTGKFSYTSSIMETPPSSALNINTGPVLLSTSKLANSIAQFGGDGSLDMDEFLDMRNLSRGVNRASSTLNSEADEEDDHTITPKESPHSSTAIGTNGPPSIEPASGSSIINFNAEPIVPAAEVSQELQGQPVEQPLEQSHVQLSAIYHNTSCPFLVLYPYLPSQPNGELCVHPGETVFLVSVDGAYGGGWGYGYVSNRSLSGEMEVGWIPLWVLNDGQGRSLLLDQVSHLLAANPEA